MSILELLSTLQKKNIPFRIKKSVCYFSYKGVDYYFSKEHCYRLKDITLINIKDVLNEDSSTL